MTCPHCNQSLHVYALRDGTFYCYDCNHNFDRDDEE